MRDERDRAARDDHAPGTGTDQIGREDRELVEAVQRGLRSGLVDRGRLLLDSELLIAAFQERVAARIGSTS